MEERDINEQIAKLMVEAINQSNAPDEEKVHAENCYLGMKVSRVLRDLVGSKYAPLEHHKDVREKLLRIEEILGM